MAMPADMFTAVTPTSLTAPCANGVLAACGSSARSKMESIELAATYLRERYTAREPRSAGARAREEEEVVVRGTFSASSARASLGARAGTRCTKRFARRAARFRVTHVDPYTPATIQKGVLRSSACGRVASSTSPRRSALLIVALAPEATSVTARSTVMMNGAAHRPAVRPEPTSTSRSKESGTFAVSSGVRGGGPLPPPPMRRVAVTSAREGPTARTEGAKSFTNFAPLA